MREELQRRRMRVDEIYSCGDPRTVRRLVREAGVDLVAVGSLERRDFEPESLAAVAAAGQPQRLGADALLVRFERGTARGPGGEP